MTIQDEDFILTPLKDSCPLFDLELLQVVNKGKANERTEFQNEAYGIGLDHAIRIIAHYRIKKGNSDSILTLKSYLTQFKQIIDNINTLCCNGK